MGTTTNYQIPYPELTDPPDGAGQMKALATKVDTQLKAVDTTLRAGIVAVQVGTVTLTGSGSTNVSATVTFSKAFTSAPVVMTNMRGVAGGSFGVATRATAPSATGATIWATSAAASTWAATPVEFLAALPGPGPLFVAAQLIVPDGWHNVTVSCGHKDCPRVGHRIDDILVPDAAEEWGWQGITCGTCGQPITDLLT